MQHRSLAISGCTAEDSGHYECIVCNDKEKITTQANLQIQNEEDSTEHEQECTKSIISQSNSNEESDDIEANLGHEIEVVNEKIPSESRKETPDTDIPEVC